MSRFETFGVGVLASAIIAGVGSDGLSQSRPPMRQHSATESRPLKLQAARVRLTGGEVEISGSGAAIRVTSNGVPEHAIGRFPNAGNPHRVAAQTHRFRVTRDPSRTSPSAFGLTRYFGVAVNGVPFDPGAAEFWQGNPRSGWQYEALGGAVALGLDANSAHVQPGGSYHYHGLPTGLMAGLGWSPGRASPLIGYGADGFPVYAVTAEVGGRVQKMKSSWRLKSGSRPGGAAPGGRYDGAFVQDYAYIAGSGDLDECNGAYVKTAEYPAGTYAYFLTETFPVVPRCLQGRADRSFSKR